MYFFKVNGQMGAFDRGMTIYGISHFWFLLSNFKVEWPSCLIFSENEISWGLYVVNF